MLSFSYEWGRGSDVRKDHGSSEAFGVRQPTR